MFWGASSVVSGEALIFNSRHLLYYFLVVVAMQMVHVPLNEERWLRRGFGAEYEEYCRQVYMLYTMDGGLERPHRACLKRFSRCFCQALHSARGSGRSHSSRVPNAAGFACDFCAWIQAM